VDGIGRNSCGFGHALGGAARGRGQHDLEIHSLGAAHDLAHDGRLADAGSAGDDADRAAGGGGDGAQLLVAELAPGLRRNALQKLSGATALADQAGKQTRQLEL
jgi:hypothetical protein